MLPLLLALTTPADPYADTDRDGLLDRWEIEGFGPIDPSVHGCRPDRADMFLVLAGKHGVTPEKLAPVIERIKKFYAELPYKNPDGSQGLNVIPIVPPALPAEESGKSYIELYERAMPAEWRGLAHGVCIDDHPGGGGQANRPDWCGTGYNWQTIVHEVGHQFGLPHDPMGARTGSPFHPSLMNYDYSYQLGGNGEAIRYSTGQFASMRMKETDLDENVPFPPSALHFLTRHPYYFNLKFVAADRCMVDWNRNGIFGERGVRADINDGYSNHLREGIRVAKAAGSPALAALSATELAVFYPDLDDAAGYASFAAASLSTASPGRLAVSVLAGDQVGPASVVATGLTGDPVAFGKGGGAWVAFPVATGVRALQLQREDSGWAVRSERSWEADAGSVALCDSPQGPIVAHWSAGIKAVRAWAVTTGSEFPLGGLTSDHGVALAWNTRRGELAVVRTEAQPGKVGRLQIVHVRDGEVTDRQWVEGEGGHAATSSRPMAIFDGGRDRGPAGGFNIYVKGRYDSPDQPGINFVCRQNQDVARSGGWRVKMMGNEWAFSRSVGAVTPFAGDIAYAYRWSGGDLDHTVLVTRRASGIEDEWITDFDEVGFIFREGLRNSLRWVQREQWTRR